jgi:hypothetical protein
MLSLPRCYNTKDHLGKNTLSITWFKITQNRQIFLVLFYYTELYKITIGTSVQAQGRDLHGC